MTFDDKVKFLRTLPSFKVAPINEVRAVAFAAKENSDLDESAFALTSPTSKTTLTLTQADVSQILHEYPHLESIFKNE